MFILRNVGTKIPWIVSWAIFLQFPGPLTSRFHITAAISSVGPAALTMHYYVILLLRHRCFVMHCGTQCTSRGNCNPYRNPIVSCRVHCTYCNVHCIQYTVQCTVYCVLYILYIAICTMYIIHLQHTVKTV